MRDPPGSQQDKGRGGSNSSKSNNNNNNKQQGGLGGNNANAGGGGGQKSQQNKRRPGGGDRKKGRPQHQQQDSRNPQRGGGGEEATGSNTTGNRGNSRGKGRPGGKASGGPRDKSKPPQQQQGRDSDHGPDHARDGKGGGGPWGHNKKSGGRSRNRGRQQQGARPADGQGQDHRGGLSKSDKGGAPSAEEKRQKKEKERQRQRDEENRRKEEEERLRREEEERERERIARDAEEKVSSYLASLQEAVEKVEKMRAVVQKRKELRLRNVDPERPSEAQLTKLDSSVKRNTTLNKKLRTITEDTKAGTLQDVEKVNQRKYVSEAAAAIGEVNFKQKDVSAVAEVCCLLHIKYAEFTQNLLANLQKITNANFEATPTLTKKRNTLRLIVELFLTGVHSDLELLHGIVSTLVKDGLAGDQFQNSLALLATFAKHAKEDFLGTSPVLPVFGLEPEEKDYGLADASGAAREKILAAKEAFSEQVEALQKEAEEQEILKPNQQKHFHDLLHEAYKVGLDELFQQCKDLRKMESSNQKTMHTKGELSENQIAEYEAARKSFDKLQTSVISLSESLDEVVPPLPKEEVTQISSEDSNVFVATGFGIGAEQEGHAFDDDETRAFYEDLPNLCAQLPTILVSSTQSSNAEQAGNPEEGKAEEVGAEGKEASKDGESEPLRTDQQLRLEDLLSQLKNIFNRDSADKLSLEFCYMNLKSVRKRVVRELFSCPRQHLELLPYYSRIAVNLNRVHPEVGPSLCKMLEEEFQSLMSKNSLNLDESRIRNIRFLGELTKFKLLPYTSTFMILKVLLDDFTQKSIDVLSALLETAGRFLFRTPETAVRMSNILEVMMKKKNAKNLDPRANTLLENAYYASKPPEKGIDKEELPPLHQYIEHLVFVRLTPSTVQQVIRQIRKIPLQEPVAREFLLKTLLNVRSIKISCIPVLASLISGLSNYHDDIAIDFVDAVLEEVQIGVEQDDYTQHQHRVSFMILLGELYNNARLVDSETVFNTLYMILFSQSMQKKKPDQISNLFRARLVLVLLNTCGRSLNRRSTVKKLDVFLVYYQQYLLSLHHTPYELSYDIQEMFQSLKPKMVIFKSFQEIGAVLAAIRREQPEDLLLFLKKWRDKNFSKAEARESVQDDDPKQDEQYSEDESEEDSDTDMDLESEDSVSGGEMNVEPKDIEEEEDVTSDSSSVSGSDTEYSDSEEDSEEDEIISIKQNLDHLKPSKEEEDSLEREFEQMMKESLGTAKFASKASNMNLPAANRSIISKFSQGSGGATSSGGSGNSVQFHVMIKKGTKAAVRDILVPKAAKMAQANESRQAAEAQERSEIKRLVLEASEREDAPVAPRKYVLQPPRIKKKTERW